MPVGDAAFNLLNLTLTFVVIDDALSLYILHGPRWVFAAADSCCFYITAAQNTKRNSLASDNMCTSESALLCPTVTHNCNVMRRLQPNIYFIGSQHKMEFSNSISSIVVVVQQHVIVIHAKWDCVDVYSTSNRLLFIKFA